MARNGLAFKAQIWAVPCLRLASGIDIANTRNIAFVLAGFGAAVTGIRVSCIRYGGDPMVGGVYVLKSIAAVVVGGIALTGGNRRTG